MWQIGNVAKQEKMELQEEQLKNAFATFAASANCDVD